MTLLSQLDSTDLLATGLLVASLLILMNVVLIFRTWPERIFWSITLCLAALWGIHQADFSSVKNACYSVVILAILVSLALQYVRHRRDIARDASQPAPNPFILREIVRVTARYTWIAGLLAGFSVLWIGAFVLGGSFNEVDRRGLIMLGFCALLICLVPGCLAALCATYFSVVERWVAWLPLFLPLFVAAICYTILMML